MATEILKKQTIVGTDAQYEAHKDSYEEGTVFESTSLLGESDIDPTYTNKFVERKVSTQGLYAYCFDTTGITKTRYISEGFPAFSLAERDDKGHVRTADPVGQNDATTKKYVDDGFVKKRTTADGVYLYAYDSTGDIHQSADTGATGYTVARRYDKGRLAVGDPEGQNDAVTKSYADNRFRYTHLIEAQFIPYDNVIVCKGIIIYVSNSATPLTSIDQLPLNVALPMHGLYMNNQIYTVTSTGNGSVDINTLSYSDASGISYSETATIPLAIITDTVF